MVHYEIGARYVENRVLYLHHNDVILLFARFMDNKKFRQLMTVQYPIVLIDEYQDSLKAIIDQFLNWFIDMKEGPQFGFFGDAWQTIYEKSSCGIIDSANIAVIGKEAKVPPGLLNCTQKVPGVRKQPVTKIYGAVHIQNK